MSRGAADPELPPQAGRVRGFVGEWKDNETVTVAGVRVWASTEAGVIESVSDRDGGFVLDGVPPGLHTLHADVAAGLEASEQVSLASASDCGITALMLRPSGGLAGRLTSASGESVSATELVAIPVGHDWTRYDLSDVRTATSGQDGTYRFTELTPGRYLLGVNVVELPRVSQPFSPTYYPGTGTREDAVPVEVGTGPAVPPQPFVLPRALPRTEAVADIICRDGSLPRSGLVYASQVAEHNVHDEVTRDEVDGRYRVVLMQGVEYDLHAEVVVPARDSPGRGIEITSQRSPPVRIDSSNPPAVVHLILPLDRCDATTIDGSRR